MLVINLWGGPGAGKSTVAAELFVCLRKHTKANVELTNEFATELCFEQAKANLKDYPYLLGNQWHRIWRLEQLKVDVAISDSPIGLGVAHLENTIVDGYWKDVMPHYIELSQALRRAHKRIDIMVDRDVYAEGGFKGNSKKRHTNWLNQIDRRIANEAGAEFSVLFDMQAGQKVFEYVTPIVKEYMDGSKS